MWWRHVVLQPEWNCPKQADITRCVPKQHMNKLKILIFNWNSQQIAVLCIPTPHASSNSWSLKLSEPVLEKNENAASSWAVVLICIQSSSNEQEINYLPDILPSPQLFYLTSCQLIIVETWDKIWWCKNSWNRYPQNTEIWQSPPQSFIFCPHLCWHNVLEQCGPVHESTGRVLRSNL